MENLQILLRQHVGKPCAPIVKVGDKVKKGTLIAEPTGLGANIFSSAYGVVEEITDEMIVIKPDEEQKDEFVPIEEGTPLEMVRAAGVVGMGGAGFPTAVKLDAHFEDGGYILVNASECEPGLKHNIQQIEEEPEKVIRGVKLCMEISGADKAIFAIKKKNRKAVEILDECLKDEPNITRHLLPDIYPMGEERAVVRECLGIELEPSQLPSAAKSVVEILKEIKRIQTENVSEQKLKEVKGQLVGRFVMSTQYPATIANLAVTRETQKLPMDFYSNYIKNIEAVTVADVKRVANKYIKYNNLRFIIVGKSSDFIKELESLKHNGKPLPIFYYDKYANKIK